MTKSAVQVLRFRLGCFELAAELGAVASVLDFKDAHGIRLYDLADHLDLEPTYGGRVGLLDIVDGPPRGVCLGEVLGVERWSAQDLSKVPPWLGRWLPDVFRPGCVLLESGEVVWLVDLDTLTND